jgi:hypothetical protein
LTEKNRWHAVFISGYRQTVSTLIPIVMANTKETSTKEKDTKKTTSDAETKKSTDKKTTSKSSDKKSK